MVLVAVVVSLLIVLLSQSGQVLTVIIVSRVFGAARPGAVWTV